MTSLATECTPCIYGFLFYSKRNWSVLETGPDLNNEHQTFSKYLVVHSKEENAPLAKKICVPYRKIPWDHYWERLPREETCLRWRAGRSTKKKTSENLLKQEILAQLKVTVTPHRSLNTSQGVISEQELLRGSEDDLLEEQRPGHNSCVEDNHASCWWWNAN